MFRLIKKFVTFSFLFVCFMALVSMILMPKQNHIEEKSVFVEKKLDGWIRYECKVYSAKSKDSKVIGFLSKPSSVSVMDQNGWMKIIEAPIKDLTTKDYLPWNTDFGDCYIESSNFSTEIPAHW